MSGVSQSASAALSVDVHHRLDAFSLNVRFDAPAGVTAVYGRSGAGKTTIVNAIAGLIRPHSGRVALGGRVLFDAATGVNVAVHKRRIGYVFQDARLFPHRDVLANLVYSRRISPREPRFSEVIDLLGIEHVLHRKPGNLSGGETQRVAIGRALLSNPDLLLMDEPLASLDTVRKGEILPYLERLRDKTNVPIVYVSHAIAEVARLATSLVILDDGKVVAAGAASDVLAEPDLAPRLGLREAGAVISGRVHAHHDDGLSEIAFDGGRLLVPRVSAETGSILRVRIEAKDVMLSGPMPQDLSALNVLPVRVTAVHRGSGPGVLVQLQAGETRLLSRITQRSASALHISEGVACHAVIKALSVARTDVGT